MYVKKEYAEELFRKASAKFNEQSITVFTDMGLIESFELLLDNMAKNSEYKEGERILDSDLKRIRGGVEIIHNEMRRLMILQNEKLSPEERKEYDAFSALVTVNDYLYAMAMQKLGCPDIPDSFGRSAQTFIMDIAAKVEFEMKEEDYPDTNVYQRYEMQRGKNADVVREENADIKRQIESKTASPYKVAEYVGEYQALKRRQAGHGGVWRFFHKKENEERTKLLEEMKSVLTAALGDFVQLDSVLPVEAARNYHKVFLAEMDDKTFFKSDIAKRNQVSPDAIEHEPTSTARADDARIPTDPVMEFEEEMRTPMKIDEEYFKDPGKIVIRHGGRSISVPSGEMEIEVGDIEKHNPLGPSSM